MSQILKLSDIDVKITVVNIFKKINGKMIPFTREIESIRKNTTAIPELINTIAEILNLKANWIK